MNTIRDRTAHGNPDFLSRFTARRELSKFIPLIINLTSIVFHALSTKGDYAMNPMNVQQRNLKDSAF
jgi:hypothetical protein